MLLNEECDCDSAHALYLELKSTLYKQRHSLILENELRKELLVVDDEVERKSIVGRSNCCLFVIKLIATLNDTTLSSRIYDEIKNYLYLCQLADDLGDWREDFKLQNYTSFLRGCFASIGYIPDEDTLERCIYLYGYYEHQLAHIISEMDKMFMRFREDARRFPRTRHILIRERRSLSARLKSFQETKAKYHEQGF